MCIKLESFLKLLELQQKHFAIMMLRGFYLLHIAVLKMVIAFIQKRI